MTLPKKIFCTAFLSTIRLLAFAFLSVASVNAGPISTGCALETESIQVLGNDFPATQAISTILEECQSANSRVSVNLTNQNKELQVAALSTSPAQYSAVIVGNSALVPLINNDLVRPLDRLIQKFGMHLPESQLITYNGATMAVAFLANAQHLFYRKDILEAVSMDVPKTYTDVLAVAERIKEHGILKYPLAGTYQAGWNLALEFMNLYLSSGQAAFKPGSAELDLRELQTTASLEMMKSLSQYMNPDFLTFSANTVQSEWAAGTVAMANLWGSRAAAVLDSESSTPEVIENTAFAGAPRLFENGSQASTLWWVGFAIAKNISEAEAAANFQAFMHAMSPRLLEQHSDKAVWLVDGYQPDRLAQGIYSVISSAAPSYPSEPYIGILHNVLGREIPDFLTGSQTASATLQDIKSAYVTAAREAGFLE